MIQKSGTGPLVVSDADREAIDAISKPIWDSVSHNPDMFGRWRQLDSGVISG